MPLTYDFEQFWPKSKSGTEKPVLFLSRKLKFDRERKYSTIEKEGLAIKWAVDYQILLQNSHCKQTKGQ